MSDEPDPKTVPDPLADMPEPLRLFRDMIAKAAQRYHAMGMDEQELLNTAVDAVSDALDLNVAYDHGPKRMMDQQEELVGLLRQQDERKRAETAANPALQMKEVVRELLEAAAATAPEGDTAAIQCQVLLRTVGPVIGSLKTTSRSEVLQMLAPGMSPEKKPVMAELYFTYDDIVTIAVQREVNVVQPRAAGKIWTPH
jgi:hypothetical protein